MTLKSIENLHDLLIMLYSKLEKEFPEEFKTLGKGSYYGMEFLESFENEDGEWDEKHYSAIETSLNAAIEEIRNIINVAEDRRYEAERAAKIASWSAEKQAGYKVYKETLKRAKGES